MALRLVPATLIAFIVLETAANLAEISLTNGQDAPVILPIVCLVFGIGCLCARLDVPLRKPAYWLLSIPAALTICIPSPEQAAAASSKTYDSSDWRLPALSIVPLPLILILATLAAPSRDSVFDPQRPHPSALYGLQIPKQAHHNYHHYHHHHHYAAPPPPLLLSPPRPFVNALTLLPPVVSLILATSSVVPAIVPPFSIILTSCVSFYVSIFALLKATLFLFALVPLKRLFASNLSTISVLRLFAFHVGFLSLVFTMTKFYLFASPPTVTNVDVASTPSSTATTDGTSYTSSSTTITSSSSSYLSLAFTFKVLLTCALCFVRLQLLSILNLQAFVMLYFPINLLHILCANVLTNPRFEARGAPELALVYAAGTAWTVYHYRFALETNTSLDGNNFLPSLSGSDGNSSNGTNNSNSNSNNNNSNNNDHNNDNYPFEDKYSIPFTSIKTVHHNDQHSATSVITSPIKSANSISSSNNFNNNTNNNNNNINNNVNNNPATTTTTTASATATTTATSPSANAAVISPNNNSNGPNGISTTPHSTTSTTTSQAMDSKPKVKINVNNLNQNNNNNNSSNNNNSGSASSPLSSPSTRSRFLFSTLPLIAFLALSPILLYFSRIAPYNPPVSTGPDLVQDYLVGLARAPHVFPHYSDIGATHSLDIVVSHYDEPIEAIAATLQTVRATNFAKSRHVRVIVYTKGHPDDYDWSSIVHEHAIDQVVRLPNLGREGGTYLQHILRHYNHSLSPVFSSPDVEFHSGRLWYYPSTSKSLDDNNQLPHYTAPQALPTPSLAAQISRAENESVLIHHSTSARDDPRPIGFADHTMFLQAHLAWAWVALPRLEIMAERTGYLSLAPYIRLDCGRDTLGNGDFIRLRELYVMFRESLCPPTNQLGSYAAQHVVSRKRILANSYAKYSELSNMIEAPNDHWIHVEGEFWKYHGDPGPSNPYLGHALERAWPTIFQCDERVDLADKCGDSQEVDIECQCFDPIDPVHLNDVDPAPLVRSNDRT